MNFSNKYHKARTTNKYIIHNTIMQIMLAFVLLIGTHFINAQTIQSNLINYQGIARDAGGNILVGQAITLDIELRFGSPNVEATYAETHNVATDAGGVFSLKIGDGTPTLGDYNSIEWGGFGSYVNVSLNGTEIGTTEMHAVPYALSSRDRKWFSNDSSDDIYRYDGNVGIGTNNPEERLHVEGGAFVNSSLGRLKIGFPNNGNQWSFATANSGADLWLASKEDGSNTTTSHFSFTQDGHVGLGGNLSPDEELVVGDNLGVGWAIPAATIGDVSGGAINVGTPDIHFSASASTTFGRSQLIATDIVGYGQGIIEMSTRQLNIGTSPGESNIPYAVRVVQPSSFGINLVNGSTDDFWEIYAGLNDGNLFLVTESGFVGSFDPVSGNYSATSDRRLKTNINEAQNVLDKVTQLEAKTYNYKANLNKEFIGFIAQDLQEQFPKIVTEAENREGNEDNTLMVDYSQLTVIALKAIKEQQQIIESLKARIEVLENK